MGSEPSKGPLGALVLVRGGERSMLRRMKRPEGFPRLPQSQCLPAPGAAEASTWYGVGGKVLEVSFLTSKDLVTHFRVLVYPWFMDKDLVVHRCTCPCSRQGQFVRPTCFHEEGQKSVLHTGLL